MKTIRQWREAAGLSQFELAVRAGVVVQSISNWELGRNSPSPARLARLAEALGVAVTEIDTTNGKGVTPVKHRE